MSESSGVRYWAMFADFNGINADGTVTASMRLDERRVSLSPLVQIGDLVMLDDHEGNRVPGCVVRVFSEICDVRPDWDKAEWGHE